MSNTLFSQCMSKCIHILCLLMPTFCTLNEGFSDAPPANDMSKEQEKISKTNQHIKYKTQPNNNLIAALLLANSIRMARGTFTSILFNAIHSICGRRIVILCHMLTSSQEK